MNHRAWAYILLGLVVSTFLGGAIRVFFSPTQVRNFVTSIAAQNQPKFEFVFSDARLLLANDWWPTIAVEMSNLEVKAKDPCITNSTIVISRLVIPFQFAALLTKKVKFGHIHADEVQFFYRPSKCVIASPENNENDGVARFERFFQKRWSIEVVNTAKILRELSIDSLSIVRDNQPLPPAKVLNYHMDFFADKGESKLTFDVSLGEPWIGNAPFGLVHFNAQIHSDEVQLIGTGNLKEGQFQIINQWAIDRGEVSIKFNSQDLPLSSLLHTAQHWGILRGVPANIKNQWVDCDLSLSGNIRHIQELPIYLHQCRLYGDLGEMQVKTNSLKNILEGGELKLQIQKLNIERVLNSFNGGKNLGFISGFGHFSGEFKLVNTQDYLLEGEISGVEFYLSHMARRQRQNINGVKARFEYSKGKLSGLLEDFIIDQGQILGKASFQFIDEQAGAFQLAFDRIKLNPEVQKIIFDASVDDFSLFGRGRMQELSLLDFNGSMSMKNLSTVNWNIQKMKMSAEYTDNLWHLNFQSDELNLAPESLWRKYLEEMRLQLNVGQVEGRFVAVRGEIEWDGTAGSWSEVSAIAQENHVKIKSNGSWNINEGIEGHIKAEATSGAPSAIWQMEGDWKNPQLKLSR